MVVFSFYSNLNRSFCKQSGDPDQMPHFAVSDLGLHYLPTSHKKGSWLIWVNLYSCCCGYVCVLCIFPTVTLVGL